MALNEVKIATVAVAYDCPTTFKTYILFHHQSLFIPSLDIHLVNPFQLRAHGIIINEIPLIHIDPNHRQPDCHSILVDDPKLQIPLSLRGTMSGFTTRIPTTEEIEDTEQMNCFHVHMTSEAPWEPHDKTHRKLEASLREEMSSDYDLRVKESRDIYPLQVRGQNAETVEMTVETVDSDDEDDEDEPCPAGTPVGPSDFIESDSEDEDEDSVPDYEYEKITDFDVTINLSQFTTEERAMKPREPSRTMASLATLKDAQKHSDALDVDMYAEALLDELGVTELGRRLATGTTVKKRKGFVSPEKLSKNWKIGLEAARRTVEATTQLAVRDFSHTSGGRRLKPSSERRLQTLTPELRGHP